VWLGTLGELHKGIHYTVYHTIRDVSLYAARPAFHVFAIPPVGNTLSLPLIYSGNPGANDEVYKGTSGQHRVWV